jgi:hypothetical protein
MGTFLSGNDSVPRDNRDKVSTIASAQNGFAALSTRPENKGLLIIECRFTLSLAGGSAYQGRGGPSPRLRPRLSHGESLEFAHCECAEFRSLIRMTNLTLSDEEL